MRLPDDSEVMAYAKDLKTHRPQMTPEEMRSALQARFVDGKDVLGVTNCVYTPLGIVDILAAACIVFQSLRKLITQDKKKLVQLQESIDRAVAWFTVIR